MLNFIWQVEQGTCMDDWIKWQRLYRWMHLFLRFLVVFWFNFILTHWGWDKMAVVLLTTFSDIFIFNEALGISFEIPLKFVPEGPVDNIPALVQMMACHWPGNRPLSEPMVVSSLTHICVTQPWWVKLASGGPGGCFKNTYELLNLRFSPVNKIHIFQRMGKIFCVEFQRYHLKFHTKYLSYTLKDMIFIQLWNF